MSKSELKLWKMDASPPARAVMIFGDILGISFEYITISGLKMEHKSPEFSKLNPLGTIPVLKDGDFVLTDSHAIMKYLLEKYGKEQRERLYPSELRTRALIDQALFFDTGVYFIRVKNVALPTLLRGLTGPSETDIEEIESCYSVMESFLGDRLYIAGDYTTIADISLVTTTAALQPIYKLDRERYHRTAAWFDRLNEKPEFKKHLVFADQFGKLLNMFWAKNKSQ